MATYKVLQDIEAEDKFLGPLTLKQFILAAIALVCTYLSFIFLTKGLWVLIFPMLPVIIVTGFLAFPWGRDQPTEVWLLAKIRFAFKPRRRIWDQSGMQELVKITAPKKIEEILSDGLSQTEVRSRLKALADTIDSRGWAVKGVDMNTAAGLVAGSTDRLVAATSLPTASMSTNDDSIVDLFDSPEAQRLTSQIAASSQGHKQDVVNRMQSTINGTDQYTQPDNFWFMGQPAGSPAPGLANFSTQTTQQPQEENVLPATMRKPVTPDPSEAQILDTLHHNKSRSSQAFRNHKNLDPSAIHPVNNATPAVTVAPDPATIELARNNDRSVESLARETNRIHPQADDDEVIISLH